MKQKDVTGIVPDQHTGEEIEAIASIDMKDDNAAKALYEIAKRRLQNVNNWHQLAGFTSAKFQVVDPEGQDVDRNVIKGDYLKIDIPGPGSKEGNGYDWVCVEDLKEVTNDDTQSIGFRVRPCKNPHGCKHEAAHFYSTEATSNFIAMRERSRITAWIIDRNITPNDDAEAWTDKIRNTTIGIGAIGIFSKIQWQNLAEGLIKQNHL